MCKVRGVRVRVPQVSNRSFGQLGITGAIEGYPSNLMHLATVEESIEGLYGQIPEPLSTLFACGPCRVSLGAFAARSHDVWLSQGCTRPLDRDFLKAIRFSGVIYCMASKRLQI